MWRMKWRWPDTNQRQPTFLPLICNPPSNPCRNCPPPSPPHCREHQSLTNSNNSPTHFELQAALRPCGGGLGVEQVWIKLSKNPTEHYGPCDTDSPFFPFEHFNLLLPTPVHSSGGYRRQFIFFYWTHTYQWEENSSYKIVVMPSYICPTIIQSSYTNTILLMFFFGSLLHNTTINTGNPTTTMKLPTDILHYDQTTILCVCTRWGVVSCYQTRSDQQLFCL